MDKASMRGGETVLPKAEPEAAAEEQEDLEALVPEADKKWVEAGPDGSVIIHLEKSLRPLHKGADVALGMTKVVLREMYAGDLVAMDKVEGTQAQALALTAELAGLPLSVVERLHHVDAGRISGVIGAKLGKFQTVSAQTWAISRAF
jgi:hypothetical protein